jgi:hypothetical protein
MRVAAERSEGGMTNLLDGCWAKVEHAKENIKELSEEIDALNMLNPKPFQIVGKNEPEKKAFGLHPVPKTPS